MAIPPPTNIEFKSHIYVKPTEQDINKIKSLYGNKDFIKDSDIKNVKIDQGIKSIYNEFSYNLEPFYLIAADSVIKNFKSFIEKTFNIFYNKIKNSQFSKSTTEQKYTLTEIKSLGTFTPYEFSSTSKSSLGLIQSTNSIKIPIGLVINKFSGMKTDDVIEIPLQKFFIYADQNILENGIVSNVFYDNQIAIDGTYTYFAQVVYLTINYSTGVGQNVQDIVFSLEYKNTPYISFYKETPPLTPNIDIKNYTNVNNKVLILLGDPQGESIKKANATELFSKEQYSFFNETITSKGLTYKENYIYSKNIVDNRYFVVYRTNEKPSNYSQIIKEKNIIKKLDILKLETSLDDKIKPNQKYYYCFRTQNIDNSFSDASLVYEVEMIDQGGTVYMKQSTFLPELKINFIKSKDFQDRVRIFPSDAQINIPDNLCTTIDNNYISVYADSSKVIDVDVKQGAIGPEDLYFADGFAQYLYTVSFAHKPIDNYENYPPPENFIADLEFDPNTKILTVEGGNSANYTDLKLSRIKIINIGNKIVDFSKNPDSSSKIISSVESNKNLTYLQLANLILQNISDVIIVPDKINYNEFSDIIGEFFDKDFYLVYSTAKFNFLFRGKNPKFVHVGDASSPEKYPTYYNDNIDKVLSEEHRDSILYNKTVIPTKLATLLTNDTVFSNNNNQVFKFRIESQNSKKKLDLNITYNLQLSENIQLLQNSGVTKQFEILKTTPLQSK